MTPLVACLVLLPTQGKPLPSVKAQLQARYDGFARAVVKGDKAFFGGLFTADFRGESLNGHLMGRRAALKLLSGPVASGIKKTWTKRVLRVRMDHGDALAVVRWEYRDASTMPGGKKSVEEGFAVTMDRWRRTPDAWRLALSRFLRFAHLIDGQNVSPERWQPKGRG